MRTTVAMAWSFAAWSSASIALACPSCPIGRTAREHAFASGFTEQLLIVVAPLLVIAGVSIWVERIGKPR
jgi:hypothetical protein